MRLMRATFKVEGCHPRRTAEASPVPEPVDVTLETDGQYVLVLMDPRGSSPILTPKGWSAVAMRAGELADRATQQWNVMGAES